MEKLKLGVIFGGMSTEHEVSIVSGTSVIKNLNKEKYEILREHIELDIFYKGETVALNEMRKHIAWYTKNMPNSSIFRNEINHIENKEMLIKKIKEYFST